MPKWDKLHNVHLSVLVSELSGNKKDSRSAGMACGRNDYFLYLVIQKPNSFFFSIIILALFIIISLFNSFLLL